jgi:phosphinothricin acetyltransferase
MIQVRLAVEADLPEILTIYNDIILNTTAVYQYQPQTPEVRRAWFDSKQKDGHPVFVAVGTGSPTPNGARGGDGAAAAAGEGRIVGFSSYGPFRAWAAYKYTIENSVYVSADQRGKGIGKLLIPPLIEAARGQDLHAIIASIDASNEASLRLHRGFGFTEVAHFRQVGYKFGRWLDLKFLELILDTPAAPVGA